MLFRLKLLATKMLKIIGFKGETDVLRESSLVIKHWNTLRKKFICNNQSIIKS